LKGEELGLPNGKEGPDAVGKEQWPGCGEALGGCEGGKGLYYQKKRKKGRPRRGGGV